MYGQAIGPTFSLPNTSINVVVVVIDFPEIYPRLRRDVYRCVGGYCDRFRLRPDIEISRW